MNKPHKHAELIKAWADGAEIQYKGSDGKWLDCGNFFTWIDDVEYRIKPKTDFVYYGRLDEPARGGYILGSCFTSEQHVLDQIKVTFDGETGKLKSAEVL